MAERWTELAPMGPTPAGQAGGDIQAGEAYSRRWSRPNTGGPGLLVITITVYACEDNGRRWVQHQIEFATAGHDLDEREPLETLYEDSELDGPAGEGWPTDAEIRAELAGYPIEIHDGWRM